jgi:hypothetical protein
MLRQSYETGMAQRFPSQTRTLAEMLETLEGARAAGPPADPRWEWVEIPVGGGPSEWVKGACRHLAPVEVRSSVTDELLAHLCPDCDEQLPA